MNLRRTRFRLGSGAVAAALGCGLLAFLAVAQNDAQVVAPVSLKLYLSQDAVAAGGAAELAVVADITRGYHINSDKPTLDFLIPTTLTLSAPEGLDAGTVTYPLATMRKTEYAETELAVYEGRVTFLVPLKASAAAAAGSRPLKAELFYQSCTDDTCFPPVTATAELQVPVAATGATVSKANQQIFEAGPGAAAGEGKIARYLRERGIIITFLIFFVSGLALNLTPCVFPVIPITAAFFINQSAGKLRRTLVLGLFYLLGLAFTYSILGTIAALSGTLFGSALQSPWVIGGVVLVLIGLAMSMFGFYEIPLPMFLSGAATSQKGFVGALMMGLVVGIIAAPCIGPFVLSLLVFVAAKGNAVFGFLSFFVLALGLGTPLVILGTFSGAANKLPRAGFWMEWIRRFFGCAILGVAVYFLQPFLAGKVFFYLMLLVAVASGVYLGFLEKAGSQLPRFRMFKRVFGVGVLLAVAALGLHAATRTEREGIAFKPYGEALHAGAGNAGKPVIIDFMAEWCLPCKELDKVTFRDPEVLKESARFVALKADLTRQTSPQSARLIRDFAIKGVPTVVFLDSTGKEVLDARVNAFVNAKDFLERMKRVK